MRKGLDHYAHAPVTGATLARLAETRPLTLACMHGSAWRGDGYALLLELARTVTAPKEASAAANAIVTIPHNTGR